MGLLPVHGFVLAGGRSSRMGRDKAMLELGGRPLVEIAVEKLRGFCTAVSIVGDREDLERFAPVVRGERAGSGPAAGVEAGLRACAEPWAMFVPVDVPLVPAEVLRRWSTEATRAGMSVSYLMTFADGAQPAFCMLRRERLPSLARLLDAGQRNLEPLLNLTAAADGYASWAYDMTELYGRIVEAAGEQEPDEALQRRWFLNVNTPADLERAEEWARSLAEMRMAR